MHLPPWLAKLSAPLRPVLQRTELGLLLAIAVVIALTIVVDAPHNYWNNPRDSGVEILRQTAMLGIFALRAAIVIIAGGMHVSRCSGVALSVREYAMRML